MSPTWFEIAVAILLIFLAFQIGKILTPWLARRLNFWLRDQPAPNQPRLPKTESFSSPDRKEK